MLWGGRRNPVPRAKETNPRARASARAEPREGGGFEAGEGVALTAARLDWPGGAGAVGAAWQRLERPAENYRQRPRAWGGRGLMPEAEVPRSPPRAPPAETRIWRTSAFL